MNEVTYYCNNCGHTIHSKNKIRNPERQGAPYAKYIYSTAAWCCGKKMTRTLINHKGEETNDGI